MSTMIGAEERLAYSSDTPIRPQAVPIAALSVSIRPNAVGEHAGDDGRNDEHRRDQRHADHGERGQVASDRTIMRRASMRVTLTPDTVATSGSNSSKSSGR